jgi:hypothetical protein
MVCSFVTVRLLLNTQDDESQTNVSLITGIAGEITDITLIPHRAMGSGNHVVVETVVRVPLLPEFPQLFLSEQASN